MERSKYDTSPYFLRMWNTFLNTIVKLSILITLLVVPLCLVSIVYHNFVEYNFLKVITSCITLWLMIYSNLKLQG